jgi:hypothetical protein
VSSKRKYLIQKGIPPLSRTYVIVFAGSFEETSMSASKAALDDGKTSGGENDATRPLVHIF